MEEWLGSDDLTQGSPAWVAAKKRRIGGGTIAVIMRASPYRTRRELWEIMTGRKPSDDIGHLPHIKRGNDAEPVARALLEKRRLVTYTTPVLVHPNLPWAVSSLDGYCDRHTLEIKTMSLIKHLDVRDYGSIPFHYELQMQWGLLIASALKLPPKAGLFASYYPEDGTIYETWVKPNVQLWDAMLDTAIEFMGWVVRDEPPTEDFVYEETPTDDIPPDPVAF